MIFSSLLFLSIFLVAVLALYYIIPNRTYRNIVLCIASLFFYAWGEPVCVILMIFSILMNYTHMNVLASAMWRGSDVGPVKNGDIIENGFLLWADSYDEQSDADRAEHKAVPVQVALTLAGSIESIVITVNVQV